MPKSLPSPLKKIKSFVPTTTRTPQRKKSLSLEHDVSLGLSHVSSSSPKKKKRAKKLRMGLVSTPKQEHANSKDDASSIQSKKFHCSDGINDVPTNQKTNELVPASSEGSSRDGVNHHRSSTKILSTKKSRTGNGNELTAKNTCHRSKYPWKDRFSFSDSINATLPEEPRTVDIRKSIRYVSRDDRCKHDAARQDSRENLMFGDGLIPDQKPFHPSHQNTCDDCKTSYVYVESSSTGRFYRYKLSQDQCKALFGDHKKGEANKSPSPSSVNDPSNDDENKHAAALVFFRLIDQHLRAGSYFLQGILAGFGCQSLYEVGVRRDREEFLVESSRLASETRRFWYVALTLCLTGAVLRFLEGDVARAGRKRTTTFTVRSLVLLFCAGIALVATLLSSPVDAALFQRFRIETMEYGANGANDTATVAARIPYWKALTTCRSVCCILAWTITSCWLDKRDSDDYRSRAPSPSSVPTTQVSLPTSGLI